MKTKPLMLVLTSLAVLVCGPAALPVSAQLPIAAPVPAYYQPLSDQQLDQLLGPIALYPDPLLAQILPAATLPTQIVLADRYVLSGGDPNLIYQQPWDPSVQALARYPSVLQFLDNNLAWTAAVGQAFINQQQQVMESIQRLRISARNFGNLQSTPQQNVVYDDGEIEILPAEPDVVYVPIYQPTYVYFQSGYCPTFGMGFAFGPWLDCDFDWHRHHLYFWDRDHRRPANWWHERREERTAWMSSQGTVWRAEEHRGGNAARPGGQGGDNQAGYTPRPHNNDAGQTRPAGYTRPATEPARPPVDRRPETGHDAGENHVSNPPAPVGHAPDPGAFVGSRNAHEAPEFSHRGEQNTRPEVHSAPSQPPPPPAHSDPPAPRPAPTHSDDGGSHRDSQSKR